MTDSKIKITKDKATEFSDWYIQVILQTKLLDYYPVSGCYIMLPFSYKMWENIQSYVDTRFKRLNVDNVYFPLLIPDTYLNKESSHIEGFTPEVVWVSKTGDETINNDENKSQVKLCIRPTSETAIYPTFAKELRSHSDFPLLWNQWCNVMRWEFTCATPFIRSREFLWQELHCAFKNLDDARDNIKDILKLYKQVYESLLCVPVIVGKKIESEKFAGADETFSIETFIPDANKFIQCATVHNLGTNFSKMFDIKYLTEDGNTQNAVQTSAGLTTRSIGTAIMTHGDNTGLVLAPRFAPIQIVVIPITYTKDEEINKKIHFLAKELYESLSVHFRTKLDNDDKVRPGWKYYYWESKGVPIRIEIGPKDVQNNVVTICNRVTKEKQQINPTNIYQHINTLFDNMETVLLNSAKNLMRSTEITDKDKIVLNYQQKNLTLICLCDKTECDKYIRETYTMKPICRPINENTLETLDICENKSCIVCGDLGKPCYIGRTF